MTTATPKGAVLVTGAARRIGATIAEGLAADGHPVAIHYNGHRDDAEAVAARIIKAGGRAVAMQADLSEPAAVDALVPEAVSRLGPLTVLINNASLFEYDDPASLSWNSWRKHLDINAGAPLFLARAFADQLPGDAGPGTASIVNVIDQRVWNLTPYFTSYTASKAALWTLTQTLALSLAPRIRVNAIGPGPVLPSSRQSQAHFDAQRAATPLQRGASPEEILDGVRFVLAASAMTGQMIALDGGQHLGWEQGDNTRPPRE